VTSLIAALAVIGLIAPALVMRRLRPRLTGYLRTGFVAPLAQDRGRVFAGDTVTLILELDAETAPVEIGPLRAGGRTIPVRGRVEGGRILVELDAGSRGPLNIEALRLATSWPLGIARAERWMLLEQPLVVHPRYMLPADESRHGAREPAGAAAARGAGDEFLGLREYRSGDSQRRIHWPTSARTGTLMVVETAQESSHASTYALRLGPGADGTAVELAVAIAASLGAGNVAAGIPLAMAVPGHPHDMRRWPEALAALALASRGDPTPAGPRRGTVQISADGRQVTVARTATVHTVDGAMSLADALSTLEGSP
jgi:uncharacterized protein (DUF58 family)